jgi:hypothetical protein
MLKILGISIIKTLLASVDRFGSQQAYLVKLLLAIFLLQFFQMLFKPSFNLKHLLMKVCFII